MTRYFFHTQDGRAVVDAEGLELSGLGEARLEATRALGAIIAEDAEEVVEHGSLAMTVTDTQGLTLFTLVLNAIDAPPAGPSSQAAPG